MRPVRRVAIDATYLINVGKGIEASLYPCHRDCLKRVAVADYPFEDGSTDTEASRIAKLS